MSFQAQNYQGFIKIFRLIQIILLIILLLGAYPRTARIVSDLNISEQELMRE